MAQAAEPVIHLQLLLLLLLLLACMAGSVAGHGLMIKPASHNYQSYKFDSWATKDYQANEANAGGEVSMHVPDCSSSSSSSR
jgi:predicted carbohydrate-binding protein with CBM5 and CBM33 domain